MNDGAVAVLVAAAATVLAAYSLWWFDRFRFEPAPSFAGVLLGGFALAGSIVAFGWPARIATALLGLLPSGGGSGALERHHLAFGMAESVEARVVQLLLLVIFGWKLIETPLDGVVLGLAAAGGLILGDAALAVWTGAPLPVAVLGAVVSQLGAGVVLGVAVGCTSVAGRWVARGLALAGGLVVVTGLDALALLVPRPAWVAPSVAVLSLVLALFCALLVERRMVHRELADEVRLGVLPPWVSEVLPAYHRRVQPRWWPRRDERRVLSRSLLALASRKHRVHRLSGEQARLRGLEIGKLRDRVRKLLAPSWREPRPWEAGE